MRKIKFMKIIYAVLLFAFVLPAFASAQNKFDLPEGALVVETQSVKADRILILWMLNPKKVPRDANDELYTCPDYTRGNYYSGQTNISLYDAQSRKIVNTVEIKEDESGFDVPYLIERHFYKVPKINAKKEGKPQILALQDFNGDGQAFEFAMFDAQACMGLDTALFGYSEKQDKVIQYPVELKSDGKVETVLWADYLFSKKPVSNGVWKYEIDYRGRGGTLDKYAIHYDQQNEKFVGSLVSTEDLNDKR